MSRLSPLLAAAAGILAGLVVSAARADEAYLCADGRIAYVAFGALEEMKRTDACVAAYFGLEIEPRPATPGAAKIPSGANPARPNKATPAPPALRPLEESDIPPRAPRPSREAATRPAPRAADDTDYRHVRVINAAAGDGAWFHHVR
jgi:hypothetical protein